ncbi:hypothetical protein [Ramlibacter sp. PS4R-6]|uniref:hypothetical protein n=1 Tax=Ramlibacter sp. PS4R-6 TaxID=3133438 RepID=UPI0030A307AD
MDAAMLSRLLPAFFLAWLAFFFGRTLRPGAMPLIERIARVGDPHMPEPLRRYTRRLTAVWVAYFVLAAVAVLLFPMAPGAAGLAIWAGTVLLFVGEHRLRPHLFPGHPFPGLLQQVRDTWSVWHPRKRAGS